MTARGLRNPPMARADWITAAVVALMTVAVLVTSIFNMDAEAEASAKAWVRSGDGCALVEMAEAAHGLPCQDLGR